MMECPVDGCPTMLQPYKSATQPEPTLVQGVAAHLATVHGMRGPAAMEYARAHLVD